MPDSMSTRGPALLAPLALLVNSATTVVDLRLELVPIVQSTSSRQVPEPVAVRLVPAAKPVLSALAAEEAQLAPAKVPFSPK